MKLLVLFLSTFFIIKSVSCQVVKFDYSKKTQDSNSHTASSPLINKLRKRQDTYQAIGFTDDTVAYYVNLTVGSQGKEILAVLDTGSSDLWFPGPDNTECTNGKPNGPRFVDAPELTSSETNPKESALAELAKDIQNYCSPSNVFNYHNSKTWHSNDTLFKISYLDGSISTGLWGTDNIQVGGIEIPNFSFAVTNSSNASAIFGISFDKSETTYIMNSKPPYTYSNFPMRLRQDGHISKITYSLSSGKPGDFEGTLLVGGVDHAKYSGGLVTVPILSDQTTAVTLSSLGLKTNGSNIETISSTFYKTLLDSGTTTANFPHQLLDPLARKLGSTLTTVKHNSYEYYDVDCSYLGDKNYTFELDFSGKIISVPLSNAVQKQPSNDVCFLKIVSLTDDIIILGDIFLSSAYIVYDLEDQEISIAQANHSSEEDIEPIVTSVPSATKATAYSSTFSKRLPETTTYDVFSTVLI